MQDDCGLSCVDEWGSSMKAYILTSGAIFGLIVLAHVLRVIVEGPVLARDPFFVIATIVASALCSWAVRLLRLAPRL